ncbi:hypothetical protein SCHPADRAFT_275411 [Schizopora paradoxa]|uniref:F-box domain-containing protein n=1 Tax=Schizopora paradoxa TaxID=27342 RepID=A0A0H2SE17_9AGAM|nr:hypothetical protein SCHPADRAFT_275411 [Schizopora paradoxa]
MRPQKRVKVTHVDTGDTTSKAMATPVKQATNRRSSKVKKSELVTGMPNEVFAEIAKYLSPCDLLQLARTSKHCRGILMSKTSRRIWEVSRKTHGLPDCPTDINEPQFADLLFGKGCSFCLASRTLKDPVFGLRVRVCSSCKASRLVSSTDLRKYLQHFSYTVVEEISNILSYTMISSGKNGDYFYLKSQVDDVKQELQALPPNSDERRLYLIEGKKAMRAALGSTIKLELWYSSKRSAEMFTKRDILQERRAKIMDNLKILGFSDEDLDDKFDNKEWKWQYILKKNHPLTEKEWGAIEPKLIQIIELRREHTPPKFHEHRRLERKTEMRSRFVWFRIRLAKSTWLKQLRDEVFWDFPCVKELIEENECRVPVTDERWLPVQKFLVEMDSDHLEREKKG